MAKKAAKIWAMIPARGGSKSIPLKNLVNLGGRPLLDYSILAAQAYGNFERIFCSTDHPKIAARARELGIEVDERPKNLGEDKTAVADVAKDFFQRNGSPDILVLVQPTSPFLLPQHITDLVAALEKDPAALSAQTLSPIPHNQHSLNQRIFVDTTRVKFLFPEERAKAYNKQLKPPQYSFGNLVAIRPAALESPLGFFAEPCVGVVIERPYEFDLDNSWDLKVAEALLRADLVQLPHLSVQG